MIREVSELNQTDLHNYINAYTSHTRKRHINRGFKPEINHHELKKYIKDHIYGGCAYCQCKFTVKIPPDNKFIPTQVTLDIINPDLKVLRKDNIQLLCRECNQTKGHHSHEDFVQFCIDVANKFGGEIDG